MYLIVAEDHTAYEEFLQKNFKYVGDEEDIASIDPDQVRKIVFVGDYRKHPIYFSDCFLKLQFEVAARKVTPRQKRWWHLW